ncbi:hypothetical protein AAT19DRAFT_13527 [Rhodotorula toruloides]|uniref:Uncharacterized protein n=1 Tax=Rhodotorula toruloides TaxID=5286 RepID=A0A2T0ABT6_RHOTO|nr:hypothetical protein AAT19DRAFT_13527 [Rhodotorula toruloides]
MPTSAARRESVLRQVREHIGRYKTAWHNIHKLGGTASPALTLLEKMSDAEGDIPSIEDRESSTGSSARVRHADFVRAAHELAETEAYVERLRTAAHNADDSGKIVALWVEQEREVREVYHLQAQCVKAKESDLVKEINPLIDEAREFAESSLPPNVAKTHLYKHEFDQKRRSARRHAASAAKEEAEMHARTGPLPPLPNYPYGGQHALAKARRSGGGYRAGLRYFGWHY